MMTKLLVYGYCVGVYSARKIQQRLTEDVAFRVLAAGNEPDFRTIADFRQIHLKALKGLFEQVLKMALELGAMKLGRVALDGSKVKANASKHKAMSYERMVGARQSDSAACERDAGAGRAGG
jgi:transposase